VPLPLRRSRSSHRSDSDGTALSRLRANPRPVGVLAAAVLLAGLAATTTLGAESEPARLAGPAVGSQTPSAEPVTTALPGLPMDAVRSADGNVELRAPVDLGPLPARIPPHVLATAAVPLSPEVLTGLSGIAPSGSLAMRAGLVRLGATEIPAVGVDPGAFRAFTPEGTAEATPVWEAVARGEAVVAHTNAETLALQLGDEVSVGPKPDPTGEQPAEVGPAAGVVPDLPVAPPARSTSLRLGAFASTEIPGADLVLSDTVAARLGLQPATAVLLSAEGVDPAELSAQARDVVGEAASVEMLSRPGTDPVAFLLGDGNAGEALGSFSYRYYADGSISPDDEWVRQNIVTTSVPILGRVTCHRLMVRQLRPALQEIVDRGLADKIHVNEYGGCYVPRFIASDPSKPISLHTWGIAIDLNVPGNLRGVAGDIDRTVVAIFKKWGFRWGGDWAYTDPMHFELGALLTE
jgi:hypothetical protein